MLTSLGFTFLAIVSMPLLALAEVSTFTLSFHPSTVVMSAPLSIHFIVSAAMSAFVSATDIEPSDAVSTTVGISTSGVNSRLG